VYVAALPRRVRAADVKVVFIETGFHVAGMGCNVVSQEDVSRENETNVKSVLLPHSPSPRGTVYTRRRRDYLDVSSSLFAIYHVSVSLSLICCKGRRAVLQSFVTSTATRNVPS
jgi:hypothetical protein